MILQIVESSFLFLSLLQKKRNTQLPPAQFTPKHFPVLHHAYGSTHSSSPTVDHRSRCDVTSLRGLSTLYNMIYCQAFLTFFLPALCCSTCIKRMYDGQGESNGGFISPGRGGQTSGRFGRMMHEPIFMCRSLTMCIKWTSVCAC